MEKEKLYLTTSGKEVSIGEHISFSSKSNGITTIVDFILTDDIVPILKNLGILKSESTVIVDPTISQVIANLAKKLNCKPKKVENVLNTIDEVMSMAAFNIVLREIAVILDQKYPDHIENSDKIYCISTLDGRIHEVCKAHIKNYRNFAAFRTIDDAKIACNILKEPLKKMFKSGK